MSRGKLREIGVWSDPQRASRQRLGRTTFDQILAFLSPSGLFPLCSGRIRRVLIFKIVPRLLWRRAEASGVFEGAPVDVSDGFVHFSTASQARETAARHFSGQDDLVLIAVESDDLGSVLRWETSRGGALFPHLYGALAVADARWVIRLPLAADGLHRFPDEIA